MLFNSFQFLAFYLITLAVYFACPYRIRWTVLLASSYYFYMCWKPEYVLIIWLITIIDFLIGIRLEACRHLHGRRLWLLFSLCANLGALFLFKYADFALTSIQRSLQQWTVLPEFPQLHLILPLGISFHTLQGISYTIEVYRRRIQAERHLGIYALYVAFFPQMVAGPIERPYSMMPQFRETRRLNRRRLRSGLEHILLGLFKKLIVADLLAVVVNQVYGSPRQYSGVLLSFATACFAIQVYADFSGYSDMAIGLARIMGYDLTINFRQPYLATSVAEYWRRWHISLSGWFRDYVYIPVGGSRSPFPSWVFHIMLVFVLSGLWHGANWTFVIWGSIHGLYVVMGRVLRPVRKTLVDWSAIARKPMLHRTVQSFTTGALVTFAFIFFRATSVKDATYIATHFFRVEGFHIHDLITAGLPAFELQIAGLAVVILFLFEILQSQSYAWLTRWWSMRRVRWSVYCIACYALVCFGVFSRVEFIYFQF